MGEVWAASASGPAGFSKMVALKLVLTPSLATDTAVLFVDEARAAAALSHPAIVRIFDLGRAGPYAYLAMELVDGVALNTLLGRLARRGGRLTPAMVGWIGLRIAGALDHAFRRAQVGGRRLRLIHRDISPQNVLIDDSGAVRLTDFGIARTSIQQHASIAGTLRGKPGYLSPEQIRGGALDDRSDVFSLGILLHESARGRRLFGARDLAESVAAILQTTPAALDREVPGFPSSLARLVALALALDVDDRPDSRRVADALGRLGPSLAGWATVERDLGRLVAETRPSAEKEPREQPVPRSPSVRIALAPTQPRTPSPARPDPTPAPVSPDAPSTAENSVRLLADLPPGAMGYRGSRTMGRPTTWVAIIAATVAGYLARDLRAPPAPAAGSRPYVAAEIRSGEGGEVGLGAPSAQPVVHSAASAPRDHGESLVGTSAGGRRARAQTATLTPAASSTGIERSAAPPRRGSVARRKLAGWSARVWRAFRELERAAPGRANAFRLEVTEALASADEAKQEQVTRRLDAELGAVDAAEAEPSR